MSEAFISHKEEILSRLTASGVAHTVYHHPPAHTMEDCLALPFAAEDVTICKNILLCNRQKTWFCLYIMPAEKSFRTADVSKALGVSRLSFAPAECLVDMFGVQQGSLAPFALWYDRDHSVVFAVDSEVRATDRIAFHPCDNTATVVFAQADFWDHIVPALGAAPQFLTVPAREE